jgi:predicted phage terminase large subunit-like protein
MGERPYRVRTPEVKSRSDYPALLRGLKQMPPEEQHAYCRHLALTDLFFLGVYILNRPDADNDFVFDRAREVQAAPNGYLDLWSRYHFKSSIGNHWLTTQDILNDPELTFCIFSHTRPIAKAFLRQIKREFETNSWLKALFPDVLYEDPHKEAPTWSEDSGIVVKRAGNPKEMTVEAWGVVDAMPTSKHFDVLLYDDVVTRESVTTPEMIAKVTSCWQLSTNLGKPGCIRRAYGTRYAFNDTYHTITKQGSLKPRIYPVTVDGTVHGEGRMLSKERIAEIRRDLGPFNFASQMLLDPRADDTQGFKEDWLRTYHGRVSGDRMVKALLVDPASSKKPGSDYTAAFVVGLAADQNVYVLDMVRDRLNLSQRAAMVTALHRKWRPRKVGYEKYGKDADIEHIESVMAEEEYRFSVTALGGTMAKPDRIKRLVPYFEQGRVWLPAQLHRTDYEGKSINIAEVFVEEEYKAFPVCLHDDMLDALSRIFDLYPMGLPFPREFDRAGASARAAADYDEFGVYAD